MSIHLCINRGQKMLYFQGASTLTPFRLQALRTTLQLCDDRVTDMRVIDVYFVDAAPLTEEQMSRLQTILNGGLPAELALPQATCAFWVVPRLGTLSPWSSKATEIAQHCGLSEVHRIEYGRLYMIDTTDCESDAMLKQRVQVACYDPLVESVVETSQDCLQLFDHGAPRPLKTVPVLAEGQVALDTVNQTMGLALSEIEIAYLLSLYQSLGRDPTDVELMMFAQVNSEHCRHKIFNATWWIDGERCDESLFDMIRYTYHQHPHQALVAYSDNAAVLKNHRAQRLYVDPQSYHYNTLTEDTELVLKVETHNHPTAISPFPGAATGSGGEIRDEAATGRGAYSKAGLCGFSVSHLNIPGFDQPWEIDFGRPKNLATPLQIMLEGPVGSASFNNEFGRPTICGYFRTFEMMTTGYYDKVCRGYHKPIMIAGGIGNIRESLVHKAPIQVGAQLVVLGGPSMAIGLGGGSASSRVSSEQDQHLDFSSVQRANPEMQRRCQEVINSCRELNDANPIISIHDVGAGGLSNALPELVEADGLGALFQLRDILTDEPDMSPLQVWCNESQERFVLAIVPERLDLFMSICDRERCPVAVVGEATDDGQLIVEDSVFGHRPIDLPMSALFEKMPRLEQQASHAELAQPAFNYRSIDLSEAIQRVLRFPSVASKQFLITIGDRSVGGLVSRDQMVGPWQVPVSDVAVTTTGFSTYKGEAMAMGERAPIAVLHPAASARIAVAEAITNLAAAPIDKLSDVALSANWMAAATALGEGAALYDAVEAIGKGFCAELGISIPVGKDSLSMQVQWSEQGQEKTVISPLSLVVTAAAPVSDVRRVLTPVCKTTMDSQLLLIDLGGGLNSLGASVLAQVYGTLGSNPPDINSTRLKQFFDLIQILNTAGLIQAYHDRSDGGLLATICEMLFASHCGVTLDLSALRGELIPSLFNEEIGAVIQVHQDDLASVMQHGELMGLESCIVPIGTLNQTDALVIQKNGTTHFQSSRVDLQRVWSETSYQLQRRRDNPACADQEYQLIEDNLPGLSAQLTYDPAICLNKTSTQRPRVAILREQGVNGQMEMAAAFTAAGFDAVDVHMTDLVAGRRSLTEFVGLAVCGGFSYGDVLGAGRGWAQSIQMHDRLRAEFELYFNREDTFTLGICNGCQMLSQLKALIPGAESWPAFVRNTSEQFEARLSMVRVEQTNSLFFQGMVGSVIPVVVSHGEGRVQFDHIKSMARLQGDQQIALRYVDPHHAVTERYPYNPNGSHQGITGLTAADGRVLVMMPHPERVFRTVQSSWHPDDWGEQGAWFRLFENAYRWVS